MMKKFLLSTLVSTAQQLLVLGLVVSCSASALFAQSAQPLGNLANVFYSQADGEVYIDILSDKILQLNFISLREDSSTGNLLIPLNVIRTHALGLKSTARTSGRIAYDGGDDGMQVFALPMGRFIIGDVLPAGLTLNFDPNLGVSRATQNGINRDLLALNIVGRDGINMFRSVNLAPVGVLGDANGDGNFDFGDLEAFFLAVTDLPAYTAQYPNVAILQLDMNHDGNTDFADIEAFFNGVTGS